MDITVTPRFPCEIQYNQIESAIYVIIHCVCFKFPFAIMDLVRTNSMI